MSHEAGAPLARGRRRALSVLAIALSCLVSSPFAATQARSADGVERHLAALQNDLDARVVGALDAMDGTGRRLLAARAYLRSASRLDDVWAWSQAEAAEFGRSAGRVALDAAIARVRCEFEAQNPGYTLFVNPSLRTLEVQVEHWNRNESVGQAAQGILEAAQLAAAAPGFGEPGSARGRSSFRRFLLAHVPVPTPTLAAPGLSRHGRMHAVDFQVQSGGRLIAGASARDRDEAWDRPGWSARLQAAVTAADAGFVGPLREPYEPWHFDYRPDEGAPVMVAACRR